MTSQLAEDHIWVPHICPVLADVGLRESARCCFCLRENPHLVSGHGYSLTVNGLK
jgi:hypothetical protein